MLTAEENIVLPLSIVEKVDVEFFRDPIGTAWAIG